MNADRINVRVRYSVSTYVARGGGKVASCTAGERQAVETLARKFEGNWAAIPLAVNGAWALEKKS